MSGPGPESSPPPDNRPPAPPGPSGPPPASAWMNQLTSTAPVAGPAGLYYADVPNRIIAYIIDAIIVGIINGVVGVVLPSVISPNLNATNLGDLFVINWVGLIAHGVVSLAISGAYFIYMWTRMRYTVGMMLLGMQVGNETDGKTLTINQAAIRWALLYAPAGLSFSIFAAPALGGLLVLAAFIWQIALLVTTAQSPTKQGLHDRYAHTIMVKAARSVA